MWLSWNYCLVPKQWMHNDNIKNKYNNTLKVEMECNYMPVPYHWQNEDEMTIFDKAYFGIIPDISNHKSNEQDENEYTVAMILTLNNIEVPECWYHDPKIQNKYGFTVAMMLASHKTIPPKQWMHDINMKNKYGQSIKSILQKHKLPVPKHWHDDMTIFDQAIYGQIPNIDGHKPDEQDEDGFTVAMILLLNNMKIPNEWYHDPKDILVSKNLDVPKEWQTQPDRMLSNEDKQIVEDYCKYYHIKVNYNISSTYNINKDKNTIAMYLANKGIIPPQQWMHDINIQNKYYKSIKALLYKYGYIYINDKFIPNCKLQTLIDTCQICFNEGEQEFVLTKCNHKICLQCFKELLQNKNIDKCPICRQHNWYKQIEN